LEIVKSAFVLVNEILKVKRNIAELEVTATPQFLRYVPRYVLRPLLCSVEGGNANGVFVLPLQQIQHHRFPVGVLYVGFAPDLATFPVSSTTR
jgi:hypothetical protein